MADLFFYMTELMIDIFVALKLAHPVATILRRNSAVTW